MSESHPHETIPFDSFGARTTQYVASGPTRRDVEKPPRPSAAPTPLLRTLEHHAVGRPSVEELAALSEDLDKMTQLLQMAQCVEACSSRSIHELVEFLIGQLVHPLQCDWIGFIGERTLRPTADYAIGDAYKIIEAGARHATDADLIELVGHCASHALEDPFLGYGTDVAHGLVLSQFVLSRVFTRQRHWGWLIAIRWSSRTLARQDEPEGWRPEHVSLIESTCRLLATQASNIELLLQRDGLLVDVVRTLVTAIEAKDPFVRGHSERVAIYARMLAKELGLNAGDCDRIYLTGLLHDIGKIGVPDATLQKSGELTAEELAQVRRHTEAGWQILHALQPLRHVLPGVLYHHERVDGQGYPDGLIGDKIPLDARILAVADAYDAMTSDRSFRTELSQERAEDIFKNGMGVQWDVEIVEAMFRIMPEIIKTRQLYQSRSVKPNRRRASLDLGMPA